MLLKIIIILLVFLPLLILVPNFTIKKGKNKAVGEEEKVDQDLQDLAMMDDLLQSKQKSQAKKQQQSSNKCAFCNNPYHECTCEHSAENKEKISQLFLDENN